MVTFKEIHPRLLSFSRCLTKSSISGSTNTFSNQRAYETAFGQKQALLLTRTKKETSLRKLNTETFGKTASVPSLGIGTSCAYFSGSRSLKNEKDLLCNCYSLNKYRVREIHTDLFFHLRSKRTDEYPESNVKNGKLEASRKPEVQCKPPKPVKKPTPPAGGHLTDPENIGQRQAGVNFDTLGSWNNRISMPIAIKESIKMGKLIPEIPLEKVGTASLIGRRKTNEDRFLVQKLSEDVLFFGIFDGHGGDIAAEFVCNHIIDLLSFWHKRSNNLEDVLRNAFIDCNNLLTRHINHYYLGSDVYNSGTTATVCLLNNGINLTVGHVGDTRAILCREGQPVRLTVDHHPDNITEKARVADKGGLVTTNSLGVSQVNNRLSMTRSIGDIELKGHGVTADPFLKSIRIKHGIDAFLILTTDGLNFVLSDKEVMDIICSCMTPQDAATFITDQALQFGTEDNTTTVVVPLGAWGKYRTTRAIPYSFGRNLVGGRFG